MLSEMIDILNQLGVMQVIRIVALSVGAIYIYRYFTDRS